MISLQGEKAVNGRRWYRFAFPIAGRNDRELRPHQLRDGDAALLLQPALHKRGFQYGGLIFNHRRKNTAASYLPMDESFLRKDDLLVLTTRPPFDDKNDGVKCSVQCSYSPFESKVFAPLRKHLPRCSRTNVIVSETHARAFPEVAPFHNVQFRQKHGASIDASMAFGARRWHRRAVDCTHTVAYLIFEEHGWENGPGILASFAMCGVDTLVWNYHLATSYHALVGSVPFAMAELIPQKFSMWPHTVEFARDWQVRLLTTR